MVIASVDDLTAMEVVVALRHAPEILQALGDAVADVRMRFMRMTVPRLRRARGINITWDSNYPGNGLYRIGSMALECMLMSSADEDMYIQSAYALSDCLMYVDEIEMGFEDRYKFMLEAIRARGVYRALVQRIAETELDGGRDLYLSHTRLLGQLIRHGYRCTAGWTYQEMRTNIGNVCLEGLLLRSLQHERGDAVWRDRCVDCISTIMHMGSDLSDKYCRRLPSRISLFADQTSGTLLRSTRRPVSMASDFADKMRRLFHAGAFDFLIHGAGAFGRTCSDPNWMFILEMLFVACPESRVAILIPCTRKKGTARGFWPFFQIRTMRMGRCYRTLNTCCQNDHKPPARFLNKPRDAQKLLEGYQVYPREPAESGTRIQLESPSATKRKPQVVNAWQVKRGHTIRFRLFV